jgi:tRNA(Met) C34 N-acetyltransferase TmcA
VNKAVPSVACRATTYGVCISKVKPHGCHCCCTFCLVVAVVAVLQTVQYIQPQHANRLTQAELLVIDEAAAIPLPLVKVRLNVVM